MHKVILGDMGNIFDRENDWRVFHEQTVLITGAYGMLASYLVHFFMYLRIEKKILVNVLAQGRNEQKARMRFEEYFEMDGFEFVSVDILKQIEIEQPIDYIIHAASLSGPQYYAIKPVEVALPNAVGTYFLLQLAERKKVKKFLMFSTGDVYGKVDNINCFDETTVGMMDPLDEHSCYGESKRMAENWCISFWREKKVPIVIARIAHTYGPTMDIKNDIRVFASFTNSILQQKDICIYSDGTAKRPFCYIADATSAFLLLLMKGKDGEAYNVSNTEGFISITELANLLVALRPELDLKVTYNKRTGKYVENKDNKQNLPSSDKIKSLGWNCCYSVKEGFDRTLKYFEDKLGD